ncbi:ABC transporter permease DevC [Laspinema sp. D1]|uniref:ABC transporter permease DevC n=1 Tax=Laspinema palackyanum TaxID=3231601 RepID=UPI003471C199|nr:ABC transporter permease DevC [Laspinema sp. D2b]
MMFRKIPLAWLQLSREKSRLLVAIAGIAFADILMFMQLGFRDALFDSSTRLHRSLTGDIVLISPRSQALISMQSFSRRRLYQTLAVPEVQSVSPLYLAIGTWKNPVDKSDRSILVLGIDPTQSALNLPEVQGNLDKIKRSDMALFDRDARPEFGPIPQLFQEGQRVKTELGGRRIEVMGLFSLGASFGADGSLITSDLTFLSVFKRRNIHEVDVGLIYLKPGANVEAVIAQIQSRLPPDVLVLSHQGFVEREQNYWKTRTAIGFVFTLGTVMGFMVGIAIVYQILYTDVASHLAEYATLKAMGYADWYFVGVVLQEAVILAILGYIPALAIAKFLLYTLTRNATRLPIAMTPERAVLVLVLTLIMCAISGAVALRKLRDADPADIF